MAAKTEILTIRMDPAAKKRAESKLKHIAALKGSSVGEAMDFMVDTIETYGELPRVIENGFRAHTEAINSKLDCIIFELGLTQNDISEVSGNDLNEHGFEAAEEPPQPSVITRRSPIYVKRGRFN